MKVSTTHDVFAVAMESNAFLRSLLLIHPWDSYLTGYINQSISAIGRLAVDTCSNTPGINDECSEILAAVASLSALGGNRSALRLGGRVQIMNGVGVRTKITLHFEHTIENHYSMRNNIPALFFRRPIWEIINLLSEQSSSFIVTQLLPKYSATDTSN